MERKKKIELLKSLHDGARPVKDVIEILAGKRIEIDNFYDALKITSKPENIEGIELIATGQLKNILQNIEPQTTIF